MSKNALLLLHAEKKLLFHLFSKSEEVNSFSLVGEEILVGKDSWVYEMVVGGSVC